MPKAAVKRFRRLPEDERQWLNEMQMELYVPIQSQDEVIGLLALAPKLSGEAFRRNDLKLLSTLADQTVPALKNAQMVGELRRLNLDISQLNAELEFMNQTKTDFISITSHELRTPLTVINGYLETFSEHGGDNPRWDRAIDQMLRQSRRMHHLIQDLMLLSRLESVPQASEHEVIRIRPLMEMVREEALAAAKGNRQIDIECDDAIALKGQATEIRSALSNLAVNAARYTAEDDRIVLRWYQDDSHGVLEVQDSGIGIEPQYIPRLTERFYRVDQSRSLDTGGTGLGLAIVKHVLLRHRAEMKISSQPGHGSTFSCLFPRSLITRVN